MPKVKETCIRGHSYQDPENIYINPEGDRECRACRKIRRPSYSEESRKYHQEYFQNQMKRSNRYSRDQHLRYRYGITLEEKEELEKKQNFGCAICGGRSKKDNGLVVDHDHTTGEIRGLLCHSCNIGLSMFQENPALFQEAISYLTGISGG